MIFLRQAIAKELETILKDFQLKKPLSNKAGSYTRESITIFEQNVPPPKLKSLTNHAPLVVVQANAGQASQEVETVNITLVIQTWDDEDPQQGEDDVLNIITRVKAYFTANPRLNKRYWCQAEMSWAVDNEQNPYFDGNLLMTWEIPTTQYTQENDFV